MVGATSLAWRSPPRAASPVCGGWAPGWVCMRYARPRPLRGHVRHRRSPGPAVGAGSPRSSSTCPSCSCGGLRACASGCHLAPGSSRQDPGLAEGRLRHLPLAPRRLPRAPRLLRHLARGAGGHGSSSSWALAPATFKDLAPWWCGPSFLARRCPAGDPPSSRSRSSSWAAGGFAVASSSLWPRWGMLRSSRSVRRSA